MMPFLEMLLLDLKDMKKLMKAEERTGTASVHLYSIPGTYIVVHTVAVGTYHIHVCM